MGAAEMRSKNYAKDDHRCLSTAQPGHKDTAKELEGKTLNSRMMVKVGIPIH